VSAIGRNAARLDRLVTNLLSYSRIQDKRELERTTVDLVEICRSTLEMLAVQATAAQVTMTLVPPDGPVKVFADAEELPRVIDNICSNAVKYTRAGGTVEVRLGVRDGCAEVVVTDTGLGISEGDRPHLFSAFHRSSNPDALTIPGTGLGLAISRRIAELHGGEILVSSELGVGSTFTLRVPVAGG
jgi:signal transduction histidine kinase